MAPNHAPGMAHNHAPGMAHNFMMDDARFRALVARFVAELAATPIRRPRPLRRDAARRRLE